MMDILLPCINVTITIFLYVAHYHAHAHYFVEGKVTMRYPKMREVVLIYATLTAMYCYKCRTAACAHRYITSN